jgi:GAF domain-containing protein
VEPSFQAIAEDLYAEVGGMRVTVRLDRPDGVFPVVGEALAPGVASIAGQEVPGLLEAPTMRYLAETLDILVQDDLLDTDVPPPPALISGYGARAQVIAAVVHDGRLAGVVSVHHGPGTRHWTAAEQATIRAAAARVEALL